MGNLDERYEIDERRRAFEEHEAGWLACMAGPGTGKTSSLIARIKALTSRDVPVDSICYLTFVREIGNAFLRDYAREFVGGLGDNQSPRISTLHSFACRLLRNNGFRINYDGELYFINITDKEDARARCFREDLLSLVRTESINTAERLRKALNPIKAAWQRNADPSRLGEPYGEVHAGALELLRVFRLLDWDQTVPLAHKTLNTLAEPPLWIAKLDHFLVDEYQDFNKAEQAIVAQLAGGAKSIVVVGDDDQSLYGSRGGSPEGIRELFDPEVNDCVSLVRCHRCRAAIVEAANEFLGDMRADARPMAPKHPGGKVSCFSFKSAKAEIEFLREELTKAVTALPDELTEKDGIVCLFASRKALSFYFERLKDDMPCSRRKNATNAERQWLEWTLDLARRPGQRFLQRLLLDCYGSLRPALKQTMVRIMVERDVSPVAALKELLKSRQVPKGSVDDATAFCTFCDALEEREPVAVAEVVGARLGKAPAAVLDAIASALKAVDDDEDVDDAIRQACDDLLPESKEPIPDPRSVLFLTIHGSKGLTKRVVVLPGLEQAILPGDSEGDELREKKRLFYVALTRAIDEVLITYPKTRAPRGDPLAYEREGACELSSFVEFAGIRCQYHG